MLTVVDDTDKYRVSSSPILRNMRGGGDPRYFFSFHNASFDSLVPSKALVFLKILKNGKYLSTDLDQVSYLILQLKILSCIMIMIHVKLTILILIFLERVGLNFFKLFHKLFILDLQER